MEATSKIVLDKRYQKKNLTYPLKMRVFQDRKYKTYSLNIDLRELDWNEQLQSVNSSNPNHKLFNIKITALKAKFQKSIFLNENEETILTPEQIINELNRKKQKPLTKEKPDLLTYGRKHIEKLQTSGNIGNSIAYSCALSKLKSYVNAETLEFESVTYRFLEDFNNSMLAGGIKINSISLYFRTIRALFNKAIKDGTLEAKFYPFSSFKIRNEKTISRALTRLEMARIASVILPENATIWDQRNLFLLSYCFIGINLADLLTLTRENLIDGRLIFRRKKTHKIYSIRIHGKAREILSYYISSPPESNNEFLLPFVKHKDSPIQVKKDIQQAIKNCNDYLGKIAILCKINKQVTTYYARYSWANIAKGLGYSKDLIAEALGHEYGNKVTGIYLDNYDNETLDNMNERVICTFRNNLSTPFRANVRTRSGQSL